MKGGRGGEGKGGWEEREGRIPARVKCYLTKKQNKKTNKQNNEKERKERQKKGSSFLKFLKKKKKMKDTVRQFSGLEQTCAPPNT